MIATRKQTVDVIPLRSRIGDPVRNYRGDPLGHIEDFVLDRETGNLTFVLLVADGQEASDRLIPVPWLSLSPDPRGEGFVLGASVERLALAPGLDISRLECLADRDTRRRILSFFGFKLAGVPDPSEPSPRRRSGGSDPPPKPGGEPEPALPPDEGQQAPLVDEWHEAA